MIEPHDIKELVKHSAYNELIEIREKNHSLWEELSPEIATLSFIAWLINSPITTVYFINFNFNLDFNYHRVFRIDNLNIWLNCNYPENHSLSLHWGVETESSSNFESIIENDFYVSIRKRFLEGESWEAMVTEYRGVKLGNKFGI